jgi:Glyoxalase-like domain
MKDWSCGMKMELIKRRHFLKCCGFVGTSFLLGDSMFANETSVVDHILLGISDLDRGIEWVEKMTGVKAAIGGVHPGRGTRNALLALGGKTYLEIIAPDPKQSEFNFDVDLKKMSEPRLITWAAKSDDIDALAKRAKEDSFEILDPSDGSRTRPDGKILKWKTMAVVNQFTDQGIEPFPFFIQWSADSIHPSKDSPKGCELQSFEIEHPKASKLLKAFEKFGIEIKVKEAKNIRLIANLKTPKGNVPLS